MTGVRQEGMEVWSAPGSLHSPNFVFRSTVALLILVLGSWYLVLAGAIALGVQGRKMMEIGTKGMTAKGEHYLIVSRPIWTGLMNGNPRNLDQKDWEVLMGRRQSSQSTRGPIEMGMVGRTAHGTECIAVPFEVWEDLMPDKFFEVRPEEVKALLAATY